MARKFDISLEKIPKGIILCLNNSDRLREDSIILTKQNRMPSAIAMITIAIEEFGKALWLSTYLNQLASVRHTIAKDIFREHAQKIKIFYEWLKSQGREPSSTVNKFLKTIEGNTDEQYYKLRMLYVNFENLDSIDTSNIQIQKWELDDWKDPQYIKDLALADVEAYYRSLEQRHKVLNDDLEWAMAKFKKEPIYETILQCQPPEEVDGRKIMTLLKDFDFKSSVISLMTSPKQIELIIKSKKEFSNTTLSEIENILKEKYPNVDVKIALE